MNILSAYLLDPSNNARITDAAARHGGRFIPAPRERQERIALLDERIAEADVLLGGRVTAAQWAQAERLRWIHVPWAGVNSLLAVDGIRTSDIIITNASGIMSDGVADQVMAYLLMHARDLVRQIHAQPRHEWIPYSVEGTERRRLHGSTLGIIGYGRIGSEVAKRARTFGMRVVATRRTDNAPTPTEVDLLLPHDHLDKLLAVSDYVVVSLPLTDETRGVIGARELALMKPSAFLVNIARGGIIDAAALIEALSERRIAGAALDVFETEPLANDSPLWDMDNVIVTPHSSGGFDGFWDATTDLFIENLNIWVDGGVLLNRVNQRNGY